MQLPKDNGQHAHQGLMGLLTGLAFTVVAALCMVFFAGVYSQSRVEVFAPTVVLTAMSTLLVYSRLDILAWSDRLDVTSNVVARWFVVVALVILGAYFSKSAEQLSRVVMLWWMLATPIALVLTAFGIQTLAFQLYLKDSNRRKAVFLRFHESAGTLAKRMQFEPILGVDPIGYFDAHQPEGDDAPPLPWLGDFSTVVDYVKAHDVDIVFLGLDMAESPEGRALMEGLQDTTVSIYFIPDSKLFGVPGVQVTQMLGVPLVVVAETPFLGLSQAIKRLMDIVISTILLVALSPVLLGVAIAVKLSSPGPIIFKQKRYGVGGKDIEVYKFRSMRVHQVTDVVKQATQNDDRITRVGRFIRKSSLDELPQFINVLQGRMSIVGPRPHAVQHNELYRKIIPGYMLRHKVKPGITGWAQVNGLRGETETVDKMRRRIQYDLIYISHWSVWFDIRIILRTALLVFKDNTAY